MTDDRQVIDGAGKEETDFNFPFPTEEEQRAIIMRARRELPALDRRLHESLRRLRRLGAGLPPDW
jgi:hypothetical protein